MALKTGYPQPLTDTQLRETPVPVSVSSTVGLTDTELRDSAVPVTGETGDIEVRVTESDLLTEILVELRVLSYLINEGMNLKENLETLRMDEESDL